MKVPKILYKNKIPRSGIYCIENIVNGKLYIGSSKNMYQRLHCHRVYLNNKTHANIKLQNSWNKHTEDNFICYALEYCDEKILTEREQLYIDSLTPWYNITLKVERNIPSAESRLKISNSLKLGYLNGTIKFTNTRPIKVYDINNVFIKEFNMITTACKELNIHASSIIRVLNKTYKQCKGYKFVYSNEDAPTEIFRITKNSKPYNYNRKGKPIEVFDLLLNKKLTFNSIAECTRFLGMGYYSLSQILRSKKKTYKKRYCFTLSQ